MNGGVAPRARRGRRAEGWHELRGLRSEGGTDRGSPARDHRAARRALRRRPAPHDDAAEDGHPRRRPRTVDALVEELDALDLPVDASDLAAGHDGVHRHRVLQAGDRRDEGPGRRALSLPRGEAARHLDEDIRINVNGCPNSCARYQTADIGLMGCVVTEKTCVLDHDGNQVEERRKVEAFLVHLGGHLGEDRAFGRKVKGVKVLASELGPYVETLIRRYRQAAVEDDDTFATFIARLSTRSSRRSSRKPSIRRSAAGTDDHRGAEGIMSHARAQLRLARRPLRRPRDRRPTDDPEMGSVDDRPARGRDLVPVDRTGDPAHAARHQARLARAVPRHRLPLRRDAASSKTRSTKMWDLKLVDLRGEHGSARPPGRDLRTRALRARPGQVLLHQQGRAPAERARGLRRLDLGLRRDQSPLRAETPIVEAQMLPSGNEVMKIHPLAHWTREDVGTYIAEHSIPTHPLLEQGFRSIGCWPCTRAISDGEDERAGRWDGQAKTECGIHSFGKEHGPRQSEAEQ